MSLCHEVNLDLLNRCFDLGPLHGLKKPNSEDILEPVSEQGKLFLNFGYIVIKIIVVDNYDSAIMLQTT